MFSEVFEFHLNFLKIRINAFKDNFGQLRNTKLRLLHISIQLFIFTKSHF